MVSSAVEDETAKGPREAVKPRSRYWIIPSLQRRMIVWSMVVSSVVATVAAWSVLLVIWAPVADQFQLMRTGLKPEDFFADICFRVILTTVLLVAIFGFIALVSGLFLSHRIAGPLYRIGQVARRVAEGRFGERVKLRRRDYVESFADEFNHMLEHVEGRLQRQQRVLDGLDVELRDLEHVSAEGRLPPEELNQRLLDALQTIRVAQTGEDV